MSEDVAVRRAVLHILDNNINVPVLSNIDLEVEGEVSEFLQKHVSKILTDNNLKDAKFTGEENKIRYLCEYLKNDESGFTGISVEIANSLFSIMQKHVEIPAADLICCLFNVDSDKYFAILKLNYKTGYTHYVQNGEDGNSVSIIKHKTLLPLEGQKIDECALIRLEDSSIKLLEREYEINGEKDLYLSKLLLVCDTELSNNEKLKVINKAAKKINKKYFDEDFEKAAQLKKVIAERAMESSAVEVSTIAEEVFKNNIDVQKEYMSEIQKSGITERTVEIPEAIVAKKFQAHKIKTDTGIEINFPLDCYNDSDKIEFINNPDGTISIVIKNVTKIMNK